jgi:hypothetical protein
LAYPGHGSGASLAAVIPDGSGQRWTEPDGEVPIAGPAELFEIGGGPGRQPDAPWPDWPAVPPSRPEEYFADSRRGRRRLELSDGPSHAGQEFGQGPERVDAEGDGHMTAAAALAPVGIADSASDPAAGQDIHHERDDVSLAPAHRLDDPGDSGLRIGCPVAGLIKDPAVGIGAPSWDAT